MHVYMYDNDTPVGPGLYKRDYLMGRLYTPLTAGQSYCVTFYVVKSNNAGYAINHIGAYLDDGSIDTTSHCGWPQTQCTPQVMDTAIIEDTLGWTKIQGSFIANGTERYITIGNFSDAAHTSTIRKTIERGSYYEVDDISVIASNSTAFAGTDVSIAAGDSTYIGVDSSGDGMPCYWYVLGGTSAIDSGGRILVKPSNTTSYVVVMDLCGVLTYDTVVVGVVPLTSPGLSKGEEVLRVWPNPAGDRVHIANAKGCEVRVYDMISREVKRLACEKDDEEMYTGDLLPGVYIVEIMTTEGERSVVRLLHTSQ